MENKTSARQKIVFTIGAKLISLNALLLITAIGTLMWITTRDLTRDNIALIQQNNAEAALSLSTQSRELFSNLYEKTYTWGKIALSTETKYENTLSLESDPHFLGVVVLKKTAAGPYEVAKEILNPNLASLFHKEAFLTQFSSTQDFSWNPEAPVGDLRISNFNFQDLGPMLALGFPVGEAGKSNELLMVGFIKQEKILNIFSKFESSTAFLVDKHGTLMAHSNVERVVKKENMTHIPAVKKFLGGKSTNETFRYHEASTKEEILGAFNAVGVAGMGIVIEVPAAKAFESSNNITKKAIWLSVFILSLSFVFAYLYSETLSRPIARLSDAAFKIAKGDFKVSLAVKGRDEVAYLSDTFNHMAKDLEHRVRVIETFHKFHNKEIADKLLSGDVNLQGERKDAVVLFTDLRDFTSLSESISAEEVVEMLNEYMTRMVSIIRSHKGIVDKFVGDAIMAFWGIPEGSPDDARNAVKACLAMRADLEKLNEERIRRGKGPLKMGMGLNKGEVIAGNIGSSEKMEYTVIGDPVNVASRVESMTKTYETDILISKNVKDCVEEEFNFEACGSTQVKGKSEGIELFKVTGKKHSDAVTQLNKAA